jgi:hypothetical protein
MSLGELLAIVKTNNYEFCCGFLNGEPYIYADMELEGFLIEFKFGKPQETWAPHTKEIEVSLKIEFTQQQEIDDWHSLSEQDKNKKYIGRIRAKPSGVKTPGKRWTDVWITLPYDMFSQIWSLRKRDIIFRTIHDLITEPNEDSVVALIERVYFSERQWRYKQYSPTKRWWKPG